MRFHLRFLFSMKEKEKKKFFIKLSLLYIYLQHEF
jgi:hypothetical protein